MNRTIALLLAACFPLCCSAPTHAAPADDIAAFETAVAAAHPLTPTLTANRFLARADRTRFIVVDVREARERAVSQIEGAIGLDALPANQDIAGRPLLVYCTIGMRSAEATDALRKRGYSAYNLIGGVLAWAQAGQDFVDADGSPTHTVHVYGARWNHLPAGYQGVW